MMGVKAAAGWLPLLLSYSTLVNIPFSPHFSHFCGLQRPSLLKPQAHFHVAIEQSPPYDDVTSVDYPKFTVFQAYHERNRHA